MSSRAFGVLLKARHLSCFTGIYRKTHCAASCSLKSVHYVQRPASKF